MERYREHSGRKERERARRGNKREGKEGSFLLSGGFLFTRVPGNFFVPSLARAQDFFRPMHKTVRSPRDNRLAKTRSLARLKDVGQKERERERRIRDDFSFRRETERRRVGGKGRRRKLKSVTPVSHSEGTGQVRSINAGSIRRPAIIISQHSEKRNERMNGGGKEPNCCSTHERRKRKTKVSSEEIE